ncbi:AP-1 complex subunit gamma-1 isoform X3 [Phthorimaea operculella]|nr:AP-1 complex subunit gamma-1 isoform X3 [Phthorimaea operculella]
MEPPSGTNREDEDASPEPQPEAMITHTQHQDALLDLIIGSDALTNGDVEHTPAPPATNNNTTSSNDILDLLSGLELTPSAPVSAVSAPASIVNNNTPANNLLDGFFTPTPQTTAPAEVPVVTALDKNGVLVVLDVAGGGDTVTLTMRARSAHDTLTDFLFQAAVPRTFQLDMMSPSGTVLAPGQEITQVLKITNPSRSNLRLRIRVSYSVDGNPVLEQAEVNNFPHDLFH